MCSREAGFEESEEDEHSVVDKTIGFDAMEGVSDEVRISVSVVEGV